MPHGGLLVDGMQLVGALSAPVAHDREFSVPFQIVLPAMPVESDVVPLLELEESCPRLAQLVVEPIFF